ncbi:carbohydrate kinase family protein [Celeribacter sp.]|uniref:carbohydrate kinase family protein n=1 Tax=Celeribacter sp. TaxID=1890673 RepID=UPI003A956AF6
MHVVGGFYRELCELPKWDEEFGSGGRAAAFLSGLSEETTFHTYNRNSTSPGLLRLEKLGVHLRVTPRSTDFVFAYFHALSRPHIEPDFRSIAKEPPIRVEAKNILLFGFLEGDAIVSGDRVVFDPQSPICGHKFRNNGSSAQQLVLVLNEYEALMSSEKENIQDAASYLLSEHESDVVVIKAGVRGAWVFERKKPEVHIPIYHSEKVFKIGTGDIFSAAFSHFWAERKETAAVAADKASRFVSKYCQHPTLPLPSPDIDRCVPINGTECGSALIVGKANTIGRKYTLQEIAHCVSELGGQAIPITAELVSLYSGEETPVLIITDGFLNEDINKLRKLFNKSRKVILLVDEESKIEKCSKNDREMHVNDFVTSIYKLSWSSMS